MSESVDQVVQWIAKPEQRVLGSGPSQEQQSIVCGLKPFVFLPWNAVLAVRGAAFRD